MTARWAGSRRIEVTAIQGGRDAVQAAYEVSPDGGTMTVTTRQQRLVFDRVPCAPGTGVPAPER